MTHSHSHWVWIKTTDSVGSSFVRLFSVSVCEQNIDNDDDDNVAHAKSANSNTKQQFTACTPKTLSHKHEPYQRIPKKRQTFSVAVLGCTVRCRTVLYYVLNLHSKNGICLRCWYILSLSVIHFCLHKSKVLFIKMNVAPSAVTFNLVFGAFVRVCVCPVRYVLQRVCKSCRMPVQAWLSLSHQVATRGIAIAFYHVAMNAMSDWERVYHVQHSCTPTITRTERDFRAATAAATIKNWHTVLILNRMWSKYARQSKLKLTINQRICVKILFFAPITLPAHPLSHSLLHHF